MNLEAYRDQTFYGRSEFDSAKKYSSLLFDNCTFKSCVIGIDGNQIAKRTCLHAAEIRRCEIASCSVTAMVFEDVLVDRLKTSGLFQTWAAVFKHVVLKGRIDRVMFSPFFHPGYPESKFQKIVAQANSEYYSTVDWALDIREAEFKDFDCRGVPSKLVRRDPETQAMVTRERVLSCGDSIRAGGPFWESWLKLFVQDGWYNDGILVAPKRIAKFKELVTGLKDLRRHGVLEAD